MLIKCHSNLVSNPQVEFDSPKELLKNENSLLRQLVDQSDDREKLYAMADGG
jgi:hypothetical protein